MENENSSYDRLVTEQAVAVNYYHERMIARWEANLLPFFECARCGEVWMDPVGRDGKHEHLCERCAEPEVPPV
jgi:formylmethanofuran dehydrogenase subunit E